MALFERSCLMATSEGRGARKTATYSLWLGRALGTGIRLDRGLSMLRPSESWSPRNTFLKVSFILTVAFCHQSMAQTGSNRSELTKDLERGEQALKANDQTAAAEHFRAALKIDPANVEANAN